MTPVDFAANLLVQMTIFEHNQVILNLYHPNLSTLKDFYDEKHFKSNLKTSAIMQIEYQQTMTLELLKMMGIKPLEIKRDYHEHVIKKY